MNWLDIVRPLEGEKDGKEPIYVQLMNKLRQSIQSGDLPESTKLPTNRELAELLKVDRSTVSRAYSELANAGLIESHVGRGTFVRARAAKDQAFFPAQQKRPAFGARSNGLSSNQPSNQSQSGIDWSTKFSRGSALTADLLGRQPIANGEEDVISFSGGSPSSDSFPHDDLNGVLSDLLASARAREMFDYSPAEGDGLLREQIRNYLKQQNIRPKDEELLILSGSQQGIELVASSFIDSGDNVVVEAPTYFWALCNFKARQARFCAVPIDQDGLRLDELESMLARFNPKLIYCIPDFQNPSGVSLSLARRKRLIEIASHYGVPLFEDNFAGELRYEGQSHPSLRSLPGSENIVIHQGTFSKALCPGLRVGWLVAPPDVIARLRMAKRASDLSTNSIAQVVLANYLNNGLYPAHLERVKALYRERRDVMLAAMNRHLGSLFLAEQYFSRTLTPADEPRRVTWQIPEGGLFIWAKLPGGLSSRELLKYAEREGVSFSPGDLFFASFGENEYFRLCFIQNEKSLIEQGIERLSRAVGTFFERSMRQKMPVKNIAYKGSENVLV